MAPPPVTPVPLLNYPDPSVSDYRLAISPDGTQIIFERTLQNTPVQLYLAVLGSSSSPSIFPPNTSFQSATRPDWSWSNGQVAFCIKNSAGIVTTDADGSNLSDVANTQNMIYPAWTPDGAYLAVMNEQTSSEYVSPRTTVIDTAGDPKTPIVANNTVWAGMPSVNPTNQNQFVFAGQWIGSQTRYDQNKNYVWFADLSMSPVTLRPLDQNANSSGPFNSAFQGRAPWWSPDGNWVAFESNRLDPNGKFYGIYIQDSAGAQAAMQVTDISYNGNHAKWFPNGTQFAATLLQTPSQTQSTGKRGIYSLDVATFVGRQS